MLLIGACSAGGDVGSFEDVDAAWEVDVLVDVDVDVDVDVVVLVDAVEPEADAMTDAAVVDDTVLDTALEPDVDQGPPPLLVITEVLAAPCMSAEDDGEWIEILNVDERPAVLDGWVLRDADIDRHVIEPGNLLEIPPGGRVVLGASVEPTRNGDAPVDYAWGASIRLSNTVDEFWLVSPGGTVVDRVAWGGSGPAVVECRSLSLDPAFHTADDNDLAENWCPSERSFGWGDKGTPGSGNQPCVSP